MIFIWFFFRRWRAHALRQVVGVERRPPTAQHRGCREKSSACPINSRQHAIFPSFPPSYTRFTPVTETILAHWEKGPSVVARRPPTTMFRLQASLWSCSDSVLFKIPLLRPSVVFETTSFSMDSKTLSAANASSCGLFSCTVSCFTSTNCIYKLDSAIVYLPYWPRN